MFRQYLLNHISCFNNIYSICCVSNHIHSLEVWTKSTSLLLKYIFFLRNYFLLAHPV